MILMRLPRIIFNKITVDGGSGNVFVPEHASPMWENCKGNLSEEQKPVVRKVLVENADVVAATKTDRGRTPLVQHTINTGTSPPIKQRPRRLPAAKQSVEREEIDKMFGDKVIQPSTSPWASPVVLVTKKDGSIRYYIDYRQLNNITVKDSYPLPHTQDCLDFLQGSKLLTTLDLQIGYLQIEMDPHDREKTAFSSMSGLF